MRTGLEHIPAGSVVAFHIELKIRCSFLGSLRRSDTVKHRNAAINHMGTPSIWVALPALVTGSETIFRHLHAILNARVDAGDVDAVRQHFRWSGPLEWPPIPSATYPHGPVSDRNIIRIHRPSADVWPGFGLGSHR